jgi:thioredoxin:protein disulfide reductase
MSTMPSARFISLILATAAAVGPFATPAEAKPWWMRGTDSNETDFLPPDVAFRVGSGLDNQAVRIRWVIADGYYLYKQKIEVKAESPDLIVGVLQLPRGVSKTDAYLGRQEIYTQQVEARVPYSRADFGAHPIQVKVTYQGCAEAGLCYPPITKVLFPTAALPETGTNPPHRWELIATVGGLFAFLVAGFALRRDRRLDLPAQ